MADNSNEFQDFLDHLTENAKLSLRKADELANDLGSAYIGTEHILLGVLAQESSFAAKLLSKRGVSLEQATRALKLTPKTVGNYRMPAGPKNLSEAAKLTLRLSWDVAREYNQRYCGTEHILYSVLSNKNARATILLTDLKVEVDSLVDQLSEYLSQQQTDYEKSLREGVEPDKQRTRKKQTALDYFGVDLTKRARQGKLDPLIGRDDQLARMITILNRRAKNNPVLIGEPGVGKTAIVEGLAQRIATGQVPDDLTDSSIIMIDLAGMIAGTKYRGEFEERLKRVVSELKDNDHIIAFIDELHLLVGAGAAEGAIDAGNILKPALARGDIQVVGATTLDEYAKHIEKDAALERRFQPIVVPQTSVSETIAILRGLKEHYEKHHGVEIADDLVEEVVTLADRYVSDRFLPDKAIDVLDEAAAHVKVTRGIISNEQRDLSRKLKMTKDRMENYAQGGDYEQAARLKAHLTDLEDRYSQVKLRDRKDTAMVLTSEDVRHAVATMTGIPVTKVADKEAKHLLKLEELLSKHVIGQDEAVSKVAQAIRRSRSGISDGKRPIGSFVFLGPTGVGKTEMARVLAEEYFGSSDALIKIDMSEFRERHTVARLVGSPAGYIGYDDGGQLTDSVRRRPYSVVLFDEIEKAHSDLFNLLLQIFEDGYLSDAKGRKVDFRNTIIVLTSNIGAEKLQKEAAIGFRAAQSEKKSLEKLHESNASGVKEELKKMMRPELINRIDSIVVFKALSKQNVTDILDLEIEKLRERLVQQGVSIRITKPAKELLIKEGYDVHNGVRPLKRAVQTLLEDKLAEKLLKGKLKTGQTISVGAKASKLTFKGLSG